MSDDDERNPEVIRARAEAKLKKAQAEAVKIEARSKMHPLAQLLYEGLDGIFYIIKLVGCFGIIALAILAIFAPAVLAHLFGLGH